MVMSPSLIMDSASSAHARAIRHLELREFSSAVEVLNTVASGKGDHMTHGLLGTAYLLMQQYDKAVVHLKQAVEMDGVTTEWADKLEKAQTDLMIGAKTQHHDTEPFTREQLLTAPEVPEGVLPMPPRKSGTPGLLLRLRKKVGRVVGQGLGKALEAAGAVIVVLGVSDDVWTNWYRRRTFLALLTLSYMREQLNRRNLHDTYPKDALIGFQPHGLPRPSGVEHFRTADGSWNNLDNPKEGARGVRFPRSVDRNATWQKSGASLMSPNPAEISQVLLARSDEGMKEVPFLNLLAAAWIQFNIHDWVSHRVDTERDAYEIPLPSDHPARALYRQTSMHVAKTERDPTRRVDEDGTPSTYINEVTSWWDGSQLYGSDQATADSLRTGKDGKLILEKDGRLPVTEAGIDHTGFNRNWWVGLSVLHTLFVREHNAICDMLRKNYRAWDDNRIYNVARLINAAVIAKIHTLEWTPAILPNRVLEMSMNANWHGLLETTLRDPEERSVFPFIKLQQSVLGGAVGNPVDKHGSPFGLSEEFTEVYRLHELLPDELTLRRLRDARAETVRLADTRLVGARQLTERFSIADLLYSFGNLHPGQLVLNNYPRTLRELSIPGNPMFDLGAVDILRARERGVPRYNEFRRQLGLKPIRSFEDLTSDPEHLKQLRRIYDNDVEAIDLLVGTRAESQRPEGFGFGETMFQLFILKASRRLQADRFYTDSYNAETYTAEGLAWVDAADFKSVLLRHYPELTATGLANVTNAFEPWDTGELSPERHPLRSFT